MNTTQIAVTTGGILAIAFIIWFFFLSEKKQVRAAESSGFQRVRIVVKGGYDPDRIVVEQGRPVRLEFYRDETSSCSDTVVFGDFHISKPLPAFQTTTVEFTPDRTGEFTFACGMNMLHGMLIVEKSNRVTGKPAATARDVQ